LEDGVISHMVYFNSKLFFYDFSKENLLQMPDGAREKLKEYAQRVLCVEAQFDECAFLGGESDKSSEKQFCFQNKREYAHSSP